jgi:threonine/homoserine/homoserine lactone efflux protein
MIYLVSRTISQGRLAGMMSLSGVALAFVFYQFCAALGITALLLAVPFAYDALRLGGALYLLWLAWQALRPGGRSPFQVRELQEARPRQLFAMGFLTNLLNPKAALLYFSLLPQFISPERGHVFSQSMILGATQIGISLTLNALVVTLAGTFATFLARSPSWQRAQRWLMGTVLAGLAVHMAIQSRR